MSIAQVEQFKNPTLTLSTATNTILCTPLPTLLYTEEQRIDISACAGKTYLYTVVLYICLELREPLSHIDESLSIGFTQ